MLVQYVILWLIIHTRIVESGCPVPTKFFVDCSVTRSIADAIEFCNSHQMTLVNLSNSSGLLANDVIILNQTFASMNCTGYLWFSSGNQTGLAIDITNIGALLDSLLTGVLNIILCLIPFLCPVTTTPPPVTLAHTVCTRSNPQMVMYKCPTANPLVELQTFQFIQQSIAVGLLDSFSSHSISTCSGLCSLNDSCTGISYQNRTCNLYM